jgi:hypothetical protein
MVSDMEAILANTSREPVALNILQAGTWYPG